MTQRYKTKNSSHKISCLNFHFTNIIRPIPLCRKEIWYKELESSRIIKYGSTITIEKRVSCAGQVNFRGGYEIR